MPQLWAQRHLADLRGRPTRKYRVHTVKARCRSCPTPGAKRPERSSSPTRTAHCCGFWGGKAEKYLVSIGREGFVWTGTTYVARKAEWPGWRPPGEMRKRDTGLPSYVPPGPYNPLGARALYLYENGRDTLYRIHGTNSAGTVGNYETSGCFRLTNRDVIDLFQKVGNGTKVIVY
ncbi:L,D-transpeptidase [Sulfitobacter aestuariivivens]|uniref:L,D-transpeptidase n=1 Tax=Sulfitobacter aestuariivivens TaxID=2766981 RepID=UPI00360BB3DE